MDKTFVRYKAALVALKAQAQAVTAMLPGCTLDEKKAATIRLGEAQAEMAKHDPECCHIVRLVLKRKGPGPTIPDMTEQDLKALLAAK